MAEDKRLREILLKKLLEQELSETEKRELDLWLEDPANQAFFENQLQSGKLFEVAGQVMTMDESRLDQKMQQAFYAKPERRPVRRIFAYVAAASVILIAGVVFYIQTRSAHANVPQLAKTQDVLPATNRARLKLSNGSVIYLDSTRNGKIADQGNVSITKTGEELAYAAPQKSYAVPAGMTESGTNELSVPRGAIFQIRLPDGTRVWLNSATDISYPVTFGPERRVKINGEAFLDVAKEQNKPFIVETAHSTTRVLGTTFNVNAYTEDSVEMITVISGAVSVESFNRNLTLHPNDQAFEKQDKLTLHHPNIQAITAWRRGFFYFQEADVQSIMRQISRFYDVSVHYEGRPSTETYDGLISRDLKLTDALSLLNRLNIKATLTGDKTIIVAPASPQQ
jgi:transmembrane sensor